VAGILLTRRSDTARTMSVENKEGHYVHTCNFHRKSMSPIASTLHPARAGRLLSGFMRFVPPPAPSVTMIVPVDDSVLSGARAAGEDLAEASGY
jgi:hypothetical protein